MAHIETRRDRVVGKRDQCPLARLHQVCVLEGLPQESFSDLPILTTRIDEEVSEKPEVSADPVETVPNNVFARLCYPESSRIILKTERFKERSPRLHCRYEAVLCPQIIDTALSDAHRRFQISSSRGSNLKHEISP
jgi:hypothetical protein